MEGGGRKEERCEGEWNMRKKKEGEVEGEIVVEEVR